MKCRATCFLLVVLIAYSYISNAQCPSNKGQVEIAGSCGFINSNVVGDQLSSTKNEHGKTTGNSGLPFVTVRYFMYNRLAFGICGGQTSEKGEYHDYYNSAMSATYKKSYTTIAIELYYIYTFRKLLEVYTLCGLGQSFTSTETTTYLAANTAGTITNNNEDKIRAQYTPLGVRYGGRLGVFLELGVGYKGVINGGVSFKFGRPCWWKE